MVFIFCQVCWISTLSCRTIRVFWTSGRPPLSLWLDWLEYKPLPSQSCHQAKVCSVVVYSLLYIDIVSQICSVFIISQSFTILFMGLLSHPSLYHKVWTSVSYVVIALFFQPFPCLGNKMFLSFLYNQLNNVSSITDSIVLHNF